MGQFSLSHWIIILIVLLLFFGPSKLPGLGASIGKAIRGFKSGLDEPDDQANSSDKPRNEQVASSTQQTRVSETEKAKEPQDRG